MVAISAFEIRPTQRAGWARLSVTGELDLLPVQTYRRRLRALMTTNTDVFVDRSHVDFIDSAGVRALDDAIADARRGRWRVEVEPDMSHQARRVFDLGQGCRRAY
jgi:anti-anti-sigma factor